MASDPSSNPASITRLTGIYNADGGLRGEATYLVKHLLGTTHCALCDITHSTVRRRPAWDQMVAELGVPFDLRHANEVPPAFLRIAAASGPLPVVLVHMEGAAEPRVLLDAELLDTAGGDVDAFHALLDTTCRNMGLVLGPSQGRG